MFTGLVEDLGTIVRADRRSDALVLAVRPTVLPLAELVVGESVCHDGACLTVTEVGRDAFTVLAGAETLARTTLGGLRVGS
ncbi:MAG TPA: riboflavin synthase, partial [Kofleriaceae bacterium]|nr:riboflavin synthase [Kofleriaceae bacterium]